MPLSAGEILGPYEILAPICEGGMVSGHSKVEPENSGPRSLSEREGTTLQSSTGPDTLLFGGSTDVRRFLTVDERESAKYATNDEVVGLFDDLRAPLRRYLKFLGLSPEDAEDGVQETFLRLHKHIQARGDQANLRGWIFQVARNFVRDRRKSGWRRLIMRADNNPASLAAIKDSSSNPEDLLLIQERLSWLRSAMKRLSPQQAECLRLRAAGLRYREIAEVMGIGISAVGELVQRSTSRLNEDFNG
jgi:RNA polymerase sigma-70 factor (ECF subfamily)